MKRFLATVVAVTTALALTACGSSSTNTTTDDKSAENTETTDDTTYKIGVLQLTQHAALDKANEGFIAALDESGIKYEVDQQNASGEQSACQTIAEKLVNDGNDLIYAIATPAAQAVAGVTSEIPIVLSAVTDPAESGLVASNDAPGGNVTGTSDLTPVKEQIELLKQILPDAKTVGILFCSSESNSEIQAAMAREACEANGLEHIDFTVSSSNEIQTVVESMVGKVDVIYAPTDNTIAAGMPTVSMIATDNGLPIICGEQGMVDAGGLATYGIDYYQLGYMAGQMAVEILRDGADPATMPIGYLSADQCELSVNDETAAALGIDVSGLKK
ncbi:ABC transporter substrate binding protein [Anaerotignum sp. MSJ-24]|uniref:ABC transporter substrate binding protein n=1 Tax=Anaerotignum sp. MSJ-24 TaxID=2841521 RepID=UPI001C11C16C|nr:ABC transporter substrate binding protein [Anaerotignum sp. MSJ-24]MBU5464040.1 ABC transporter substrate-binding protein [Anaerotignum sp. MSJ-24]